MPRQINLRQIEAFKAVIEVGVMRRAAELLNISQPAMSKLIAHLEFDAGIRLFDRHKGRLLPTEQGMLLYEEIDRIFAGVRQVENALQSIRRQEQGRLIVGVMPALAGFFIQSCVTNFLKDEPKVFCSVESLGSQWIVDGLIARKLDVGLIDAGIDNPYVIGEPLMEQPLVCIMPLKHPLASKRRIKPKDLHETRFVSSYPDTHVGRGVAAMLASYDVHPQFVMAANVAPTLCELVAAGHGVSLVPPLSVSGLQHKLTVRRFDPDIMYNFQLCRSADRRNAKLVDAFTKASRQTANDISEAILSGY
jgi:DNA-binding transcriptional LysR family regulator